MGYWNLTIDKDGDLNEDDLQHIADKIVEGYMEGDLVDDEPEEEQESEETLNYSVRNYWSEAFSGTHSQGSIDISYQELLELLGKPIGSYQPGEKIDAEWLIEFEDGTVASIYNYKDGISYNGREDGTPTKDIRDWHIGGHDERSTQLVFQLFNR